MELYITAYGCWALAVGEGDFIRSHVLRVFVRRG